MNEKQSVDPQIEDFIRTETQKQRFQVNSDKNMITYLFNHN